MLGDAVLHRLAGHDPVCGIDDGIGSLHSGQDLCRGTGRSSGRYRQHHLQQADDYSNQPDEPSYIVFHANTPPSEGK